MALRDGNPDAGALTTVLDAMTAFRAQPQLTKWNWSVFFGDAPVGDQKQIPPEVQQINVLTAMDKMSRSGSYEGRTLRVFYDALCDCVHPNRGSYALFMDMCETSDIFWKPSLAAQPTHDEATQTALVLVAVPLLELSPKGAAVITELLDWHRAIKQLRGKVRMYL